MVIYSKEEKVLFVPERDYAYEAENAYKRGYRRGYHEAYDDAYNEKYQEGYDAGFVK